MLIEDSPHDSHMSILNLGSFPKKVLDFQESHEFFSQIVFADYQLRLLLQHEFGGRLLTRISRSSSSETAVARISELIQYVLSVDANYALSHKLYEESLYYAVVLAHLHHVNSDPAGTRAALRSVTLKLTPEFESPTQAEFVVYLTARYYALLGASTEESYARWIEYLVSMKQYGNKSQVAANEWNDEIFRNVLKVLSSNGSSPLRFNDLITQQFTDNACALVAVSNHALKPENEKYILKDFRTDYITFLAELLSGKIKQKLDFPDASAENSAEITFVETLYETLNDISAHRPVITYFLKPSLSKKFLVNVTEKTYQCQIVLLNLIRTLIDASEFDEALGAFKTYATYVDKDAQQHDGSNRNILEVIDIYATCLYDFNPLSSIIPDAKSSNKKFKYNTLDNVVEELKSAANALLKYLQKFTSLAALSYDEELETFADNDLSFLYHRYNTNFLANDESKIVRVLSKAWSALGHFHYYLATYDSADTGILEKNTRKVAHYYKNSLIINSTGNVTYLFNYAYTLAQSNSLISAVRLCKFILKRYPESFKTWNLLALVTSALEQHELSQDTTEKTLNKASILDSLTEDDKGSVSAEKQIEKENGHQKSTQLEKFIEDALNIAGLYMVKNRQNGVALSLQTKYEILQLKMTQLAVWEANQGVEYILESVKEIFALYRELFQESAFSESGHARHASAVSRAEGRWSHRPSVLDPSDLTLLQSKEHTKDKSAAKERIKRLSHVAHEVKPHRAASKPVKPTKNAAPATKQDEQRILQDIWLWTASIYLKLGLLEETEQCIVEAETVEKPNVKTFTFLGLLTSKSRKFLSLQEYERSLEVFHSPEERFNRKAYGVTLLGMCKLFLIDDDADSSLFISSKDLDAGLIRLKNYLEQYSLCWPYGANSSELWYFLSTIYEKFDDKVLFKQALWKCVELESRRPVRSYDVCEDFN